MSGVRSAVQGISRWCWVERGVAVERGLVGWWAVEAPPLEIGKEAPLEVVGEWEWVGGDLVGGWFASSSGISREVG